MEESNKCPVCDNLIIRGMPLCNPCQEQKDKMKELRRQKARDKAFGSPWDCVRKD